MTMTATAVMMMMMMMMMMLMLMMLMLMTMTMTMTMPAAVPGRPGGAARRARRGNVPQVEPPPPAARGLLVPRACGRRL